MPLNGIDLAVMEDLAATLSQEYAQKKLGRLDSTETEWNDTVNHSFYKVFLL